MGAPQRGTGEDGAQLLEGTEGDRGAPAQSVKVGGGQGQGMAVGAELQQGLGEPEGNGREGERQQSEDEVRGEYPQRHQVLARYPQLDRGRLHRIPLSRPLPHRVRRKLEGDGFSTPDLLAGKGRLPGALSARRLNTPAPSPRDGPVAFMIFLTG